MMRALVTGVGGMVGSLLLAIFALSTMGGSGLADGMTVGKQLSVQALAVAVAAEPPLVKALALTCVAAVLAHHHPVRPARRVRERLVHLGQLGDQLAAGDTGCDIKLDPANSLAPRRTPSTRPPRPTVGPRSGSTSTSSCRRWT